MDRSDFEVGIVAFPEEEAEDGCDGEAEHATEVEEVLQRNDISLKVTLSDRLRTKMTRTMMTHDSTRKSQLSVGGPELRSDPTESMARAHSINIRLQRVYAADLTIVCGVLSVRKGGSALARCSIVCCGSAGVPDKRT